MSLNTPGRLKTPAKGSRSFYENLRTRDEPSSGKYGRRRGQIVDDENLQQQFSDLDAEGLNTADSRMTLESASQGTDNRTRIAPEPDWHFQDDDLDNDVPASLLVEPHELGLLHTQRLQSPTRSGTSRKSRDSNETPQTRAHWESVAARQQLHRDNRQTALGSQPRSLTAGRVLGGPKDQALWRWVNITNLDSFVRDVYDYYEGGGLWCILCGNALWLLQTLFVTVLVVFLGQCVDYSKIPHSKSLDQVVISQCTAKMPFLWNLGIWMYIFFFFWKVAQYFFEIRRLAHVRRFYTYLLEIPEQDMQTVSWQDVVARVMALRDQNPKTAANVPQNLRRFIGSQSKERLDAHDIANRLMRKENYLIAMINKDLLNLTLPIPLLRGRQLFSKTLEWYLHFCILDMAFNELGQVQQDFLRADRRRLLSKKLRERLIVAGILNLVFAPIVLGYVIIVYFFTYYYEYQKDPSLAAARKFTALAEWKFREFNELPHIFYERLHMSYPFATRYVDQFPKRMTEDIARSVAFMSGAITAILAVATVLDSELFLGFEITKDRTVLFYLGVFGAIWAVTRGMVSEETLVFNPEYALRNVIDYTHYMPSHWEGRLHSFEVKQEFSELYKMKVVILLEEIMGIITTPLLLLFSLPKCSDQIVDFFREFTIHVDGLGYVCSFAVFDFQKGTANMAQQRQGAQQEPDVREDYYSTKHGKMAASYYGFIDNYVVNPKTGIPGHLPPGLRQQFHPPPAFPGLNSPTVAGDMHVSQPDRSETGRTRSRAPGLGSSRLALSGPFLPLPSPLGSALLDPRHQPIGGIAGTAGRSMHKSRYARVRRDPQTIDEVSEAGAGYGRYGEDEDLEEGNGMLGESNWQTSPGKGLSRENSAANMEEPETGVLGMIYQLRQAQHNRPRGVV